MYDDRNCVFLLGPRLFDLRKLDQCRRKLKVVQAWYRDSDNVSHAPHGVRPLAGRLRGLEARGMRYCMSNFHRMDFDEAFESLKRRWPNDLTLCAPINADLPYERVVALTLTTGTDTKGGAKTLLKWIWRLGLLKNVGMVEL